MFKKRRHRERVKRLKEKGEFDKNPTNVINGMVEGTKGLFKGFGNGILGIVTEPYEGAKKEGIKGAFKGVGKGIVGLVMKPLGGTI